MKNLVFILLIITGLVGCEQLGRDSKVAKIETIKDKVRTIDSANASKDLLSEPANINQKKPDNKTKAAKMAYNAGVQYYQKGDLDNALMQFKKVLENTPVIRQLPIIWEEYIMIKDKKSCHYLTMKMLLKTTSTTPFRF